MKENLSKIVVPTLDSSSVSIEDFKDVPVYFGEIENEIGPNPTPKCFLGAYYRKVFSSKDQWLGIEGTITLGEFTPDQARFGNDGRTYFDRYLDNPSIYMGGQSLTESDAGLNMNAGYETTDTSAPVNYGTPKIAYRPFWRYIYSDCVDVFGNVERHSVNSWNVTDPKRFEFYYFPGDVIRMSVYSPLPNYLQLRIEVIEPTQIEKYKKQREAYGLKDNKPATFLSPIFYSEGHGNLNAEFKRVNSIDQYANEGSNAKSTNANVSEANWKEVYLYRRIDGKMVKVPFTDNRQTSMACPSPASFTLNVNEKQKELGGESITIHPAAY